MPAKKSLGRGLGAIVSLQPVREGGSARIDEAIRASPGPSVLALSGETFEAIARAVEETARATVPNAPRHTRNGIAERVVAPAAPAAPEEVQYSLFERTAAREGERAHRGNDSQVDDGTVAEEPVPLPTAPAPRTPEPAPDPAVLAEEDGLVLFIDDEIGDVVLPEVELE